MKFGLSIEQYQQIKAELKPLYERGAKIYCFGSRARHSHAPFSDLDLMVESNADLGFIIHRIMDIFIDSSLPIIIDLVQKRDFASSYLPQYESEKQEF